MASYEQFPVIHPDMNLKQRESQRGFLFWLIDEDDDCLLSEEEVARFYAYTVVAVSLGKLEAKNAPEHIKRSLFRSCLGDWVKVVQAELSAKFTEYGSQQKGGLFNYSQAVE